MKQLFAAASLVALLAAAPAIAAEAMSAKDFVRQAQEGNMAEVELGRIAQNMAQSQDVKGFAEGMVNDHGKAMDQLTELAKDKNIDLPGKLDDAHQKKAEKLQGMKGAEFDQAYLSDMVKDHQREVQRYQQAQKSVDDSDIKAYIQQTLPILQQHLQTAQKLNQPQAAAADKSGQTKEQTR